MSDESRIADLLLEWEELRERGQPPTAEELCHDRPELVEPLRKQIRALEAFLPVLDRVDDCAETKAENLGGNGPHGLPGISGYEILSELGRGGMGVVYLARDTRLKRLAAVKMILAGAHAGRDQKLRFQREAEAVARLRHPNIVQIYGMGEQEGRPYLELEYVAGGSLDRKLSAGPLPAREAARLLETLARAVHAAHESGIVHRDLKPANVLLAVDGTPKITDFGLAKELAAEPNGVAAARTHTGAVVGTPRYMAPEQAHGGVREIGPRTDVFALGVILYECLTGRAPFHGDTLMETLEQVMFAEPAAPRRLRHATPRDLETICLKCLRKEAAKRYASAQDLAEDLRRFQAGEPIRARPVRLWERSLKWARRRPAAVVIALLLLLTAAGLGAWIWRWQADESARKDQEASRRADEEAHALHTEYYANFRNRAGGAEGVGPLTEEEAHHRQASFRFRRRNGRTEGFDLVDGHDRLAPNQAISAFLDGLTGQVEQRQCRYEYTYAEGGGVVEARASDRAGVLVFRLKFTEPNLALYLRAGFPEPRTGSGAAYVQFVYDDAGFYLAQLHLSGPGQPRPDHDGVYAQRFDNNADGRPIRITYLGPDGKTPTYHRDGYAAETRTCNERGDTIEVAYWDADGKPTRTKEGYHAAHRSYDRWGNLVEITYRNADGERTRHRDGFARVAYSYNEHGDCTEVRYFDLDERLVPLQGVAPVIVWEYDEQGNRVRETYRDGAGQPSTRKTTAEISYRYDENGECLETVRHLAALEKRPDRCATVSMRLKTGHPVEFVCRDAAGALTFNAEVGYARYEADFNDRGDLTQEKYFDAHDRPALHDGYFQSRYGYDYAGNLERIEYLDAEGKRVVSATGYAVMQVQHDALGNIARKEYLDADGHPARQEDGSYGLAIRFDDRGQAIESTRLDQDLKPLGGAASTARWKMTYDRWGNLIEQSWWDADDRPALNNAGFFQFKKTYDPWGNCLSEEYFDREGRPFALKNGVCRWVYTFDAHGAPLTRRGYDASGQLAVNQQAGGPAP